MGISLDDFLRLTPEEFSCAAAAYRRKEDAKQKDDWQRMRLLATIVIQPHVKGKMHPEKLLPLPWDKKNTAPKAAPKGATMTAEERKRRIQRLLRKD